MAGNAFVPLFPTIVMASGATQTRDWVWAGLTLLAGLGTMLWWEGLGNLRSHGGVALRCD
jgi:hypothetical protein